MNNTQTKIFLNPESIGQGLEAEALIAEFHLEMQSLAVSAGTTLLLRMMQKEAKKLTGKRYSRRGEVYGHGSQKGYAVLGGQKVPVMRPRFRTGKGKGKEVHLVSYKLFQQNNARTNTVYAKFLASVSCREYKGAIEKVQAAYGISKSVVSREIITATAKDLDEMFHRSLKGLDLVVLLIDGIDIGGTVFICAMGVDREGYKHILGFLDGETENSAVCIRLLENLRDRSLELNRPLLAVLDGSTALSKAVRDTFGDSALIQRCQEHKIRNVRDYLAPEDQGQIESKMRAAYRKAHYSDARRALQTIVRELEKIDESAARSLEEGLEETLTVHRLQMPAVLRRSFATTNLIESTYSNVRHLMRNVKRWRNNNQRGRWFSSALLKTEKSFQRVAGYRSMGVLIAALETIIHEVTMAHMAA